MTLPFQDYRTIPLTQGKVAIVDSADYTFLCQWKWQALFSRKGSRWYAIRTTSRGERDSQNHNQNVFMHRLVLGLLPGDRKICDHVNRDSLDNRRSNLRVANASQNRANSKVSIDNRLGLKGVTAKGRFFVAQIQKGRVNHNLGTYDTPQEAHAAYCGAAKILFGEFACAG